MSDQAPPLARDRRAGASRDLFEWDARDETTTSRTGQPSAFSRASGGGYLDARGYYRVAPHSRPRFGVERLGGLFGLLVEPERTNYVKRSEDLSHATDWAPTNLSATTGVEAAGLTLNRLTDTTAAAAGTVSQSVSWGATGWEVGVSLHVRQGTSAGWTLTLTAAANYLTVHGTWAADGSPVIAIPQGAYLGAVRLAAGVWRLLFRSAGAGGVSSADLSVAPASGATGVNARQGYTDLGAVQVERHDCTSYIRVPAGTAQTRARDRFTVAIGWTPRDLSIGAEWARPSWVGLPATPGYYRSTVDLSGTNTLLYDADAGIVRGYVTQSGSSFADRAYPAGALGDTVRAVARIRGTSTRPLAEVETTDGTVAGAETNAPLTAYATNSLGLGCNGSLAGYELSGILRRVSLRAGTWSLAQLLGGG